MGGVNPGPTLPPATAVILAASVPSDHSMPGTKPTKHFTSQSADGPGFGGGRSYAHPLPFLKAGKEGSGVVNSHWHRAFPMPPGTRLQQQDQAPS